MGVSRSATLVLAYLLWHSRQAQAMQEVPSSSSSTPDSTPDAVPLPPTPLTLTSALSLIRQCRPQVEPNSGFIKQLRMYEAMDCPTTQQDLESHKIYRRWMNSREVMDALSGNRAPKMAHISFRDEEDENQDDDAVQRDKGKGRENATLADKVEALDISNPDGDDPTEITNPDITLSSPSPAPPVSPNIDIKCRKCRRLLAKSTFILPHKPPPHRDPSAQGDSPCAHIFLHPLSWMRPTLSQGELDGRITCPTAWCGANIGKFAWQGLRCSCGGWVTPGFGLAKGKVDEVHMQSLRRGGQGRGSGLTDSTDSSRSEVHSAIRLPPGMKKPGNGHL